MKLEDLTQGQINTVAEYIRKIAFEGYAASRSESIKEVIRNYDFFGMVAESVRLRRFVIPEHLAVKLDHVASLTGFKKSKMAERIRLSYSNPILRWRAPAELMFGWMHYMTTNSHNKQRSLQICLNLDSLKSFDRTSFRELLSYTNAPEIVLRVFDLIVEGS